MAGTQTLEQLVVLVSVSESLLLLSDPDRRTGQLDPHCSLSWTEKH